MTGTDNGGIGVKREDIAIKFQILQDENIKFKTKLKNSLDLLRVLKPIDNVSEEHLSHLSNRNLGIFTGIYANKLEIVEVYQSLKLNIDPLIVTLTELIKVIEEEQEELSKYFKTLNFENIMSLKHFEQKAISYNQKQRTLFYQVVSKIPNLEQLENKLFGIVEHEQDINHAVFVQAAKEFYTAYSSFYAYLSPERDKGNSKEHLFLYFINIIKYLEYYIRVSEGLHQNYGQGLISSFKELGEFDYNEKITKSAQTFLNNFFDSNATKARTIITNSNQFLKDLGYENSTFKKSYEDVNKEGKLDDFFRDALKSLLERHPDIGENEEKDINDIIEEIIPKKTDIDNLFKEFNKLYEEFSLEHNKFGKIKLKGNKKLQELQIKDLNEELVSFKELIFDDEGKKFKALGIDNAKYLVNNFKQIIGDMNKDGKNNAFNTFLEYNENVIDNTSTPQRSGGDGEAWYDNAVNGEMDREKTIQEIETLISYLDIDEYYNDDRNLTEEVSSNLNISLENIKEGLKNIFASLNREKNKGWTSSIRDLKTITDNVGHYFKQLNPNNFRSKSSADLVIGPIKENLEIIQTALNS